MTAFEEAEALFLECFEASREEAEIILGYAEKYGKIDILYRNGETVNTVCSTKIADKNFEASYIFAAATKPGYRNQGIFRRQLESLFGDSPVVLIPENESLFRLYSRLGFEPIFGLEADIIGSGTAKDFVGSIDELYMIYKSSFQFPKKDLPLFEASVKAHLSYGGEIKHTDESAILIIGGRVSDVFAPTAEEALRAAESALIGEYKVLLPLLCIDALDKNKINYRKKSIAMGKNLNDTEIYINTLFN